MSLIRNSILLFLIHTLSITIEAINYLSLADQMDL